LRHPLSEIIFLKALEIMIIVLSYFERQATVGGICRWQRQLKNPTALAVGFRGIGILPNKHFSQKICNRQAYYIACRHYRNVPITETFYEQSQTPVAIIRISAYNIRKCWEVLYGCDVSQRSRI